MHAAAGDRTPPEHRDAVRVEVYLYDKPFGSDEIARFTLEREGAASSIWTATVPLAEIPVGEDATLYYGYRAWGPNWPFRDTWRKGSDAGFLADFDAAGNRFNPNKLLTDPYALEVSHDRENGFHRDGSVYASGKYRTLDSGLFAPKGIILRGNEGDFGTKPTRPLKDDIIYEVHVRGLTMNDPSVSPSLRGTFQGAALKAPYLKDLGVTAVEFLPVQETVNDQNDVEVGTDGDNYWGYMTTNYFAPDRRYARDKSPGGPTREFQAMVREFHRHGIKVYIDVVYNHTGEGGLWRDGDADDPATANIRSWRGLDNAGYYELSGTAGHYYDNSGCGPNFNCASPVVVDQVIDSLRYWKDVLGVDGFRFDLAPVLGNDRSCDGFRFNKMNPANILNRAVRELPVRSDRAPAGADLIAEPWAIGHETQQTGNFPAGWAEWNDKFRDTIRADQNQLGITPVKPGVLAARLTGSPDLFQDDQRKPWHSVNFIVAHDGFTLRDLYSHNAKNNQQGWPRGPSDGGNDNSRSWDQGGVQWKQRQAARTGLLLLMTAAGVPMITGGDERYRTLFGNNNPYNLDSQANHISWDLSPEGAKFYEYCRHLIRFRGAHPALRPAEFFTGRKHAGRRDITWYDADGRELAPEDPAWDDPQKHFLAFRIDGEGARDRVRSILVVYNGWHDAVDVRLAPPGDGYHWRRVSDTAHWMESRSNFALDGDRLTSADYTLWGRSALLLIEAE